MLIAAFVLGIVAVVLAVVCLVILNRVWKNINDIWKNVDFHGRSLGNNSGVANKGLIRVEALAEKLGYTFRPGNGYRQTTVVRMCDDDLPPAKTMEKTS